MKLLLRTLLLQPAWSEQQHIKNMEEETQALFVQGWAKESKVTLQSSASKELTSPHHDFLGVDLDTCHKSSVK